MALNNLDEADGILFFGEGRHSTTAFDYNNYSYRDSLVLAVADILRAGCLGHNSCNFHKELWKREHKVSSF